MSKTSNLERAKAALVPARAALSRAQSVADKASRTLSASRQRQETFVQSVAEAEATLTAVSEGLASGEDRAAEFDAASQNLAAVRAGQTALQDLVLPKVLEADRVASEALAAAEAVLAEAEYREYLERVIIPADLQFAATAQRLLEQLQRCEAIRAGTIEKFGHAFISARKRVPMSQQMSLGVLATAIPNHVRRLCVETPVENWDHAKRFPLEERLRRQLGAEVADQ